MKNCLQFNYKYLISELISTLLKVVQSHDKPSAKVMIKKFLLIFMPKALYFLTYACKKEKNTLYVKSQGKRVGNSFFQQFIVPRSSCAQLEYMRCSTGAGIGPDVEPKGH